MDLQLHSMHVVVQGFTLLMLASLTEPRTPTIVQVFSEEWKCDPPCDNTGGMFCLGSQCVECGICPKDPFDVDRRGYLQIYTTCIQNGFCPRVCSPYLNFASHLRANETFCEDINAPKVTTPRSTTEEVVETTTTSSAAGVTSLKPEADTTTTLHPVIFTNIGNNDFPIPTFYIVICVVVLSTFVGIVYCFKTRFSKLSKRPRSSPCSLTEDTDPLIYETLEIQLNEANQTATVKGLQRLNCNALQLCACLYNPDHPTQNWMLTRESDEMELPGVMIPHQVYTVKAGRVDRIDRREFDCIAEGKVNTEEFTNVALDDECSTTVENIFENIDLRRSLQVELHQPEMIDVIVSVFKLKGDDHLNFKFYKDLDKLYNEVLTTQNDVVHSSIHILMEDLARHDVAKDFVRKIAKRDIERYCKKCLKHLHSMCCRNPDESVVNIS